MKEQDALSDEQSQNAQVLKLRKYQNEAWELKASHIIWPGTLLNDAIGSWDEGICLVAALENLGKSSFLVQTMVKVLVKNPEVALLDISLDDSFRERTRRYAGCIAGVDTKIIARPILGMDSETKKRENAYNIMAEWMFQGRLEIKTASDDEFNQPHQIVNYIKEFGKANPGKKIVVIIDAWNDIILPEVRGEEAEKCVLQDISNALKEIQAICLMTAHRRKSSGSDFTRRVSNDEIKGSAYLKFMAKVIFTLHNEVKSRRKEAEVFWCLEEEPDRKMPVLEISVQKNKSCDFDGWIFYKFIPNTGRCQEADYIESQYWEETARNSMKRRAYSRE